MAAPPRGDEIALLTNDDDVPITTDDGQPIMVSVGAPGGLSAAAILSPIAATPIAGGAIQATVRIASCGCFLVCHAIPFAAPAGPFPRSMPSLTPGAAPNRAKRRSS